jgi:hypothetical protein
MAEPLQEILGARNLIGRIVDIVNGVPEDLLPPGFVTANRTTEGDRGEYLRVEGTRQNATIARYGAPSKHQEPVGIKNTPVKLLHSFEDFSHDPALLQLLISEAGNSSMLRQQLARETISRQLEVFGTRFKNLRMSAVYSILATGKIVYGNSGELYSPADSAGYAAAANTIDFGVPAGNKSQLNVFGTGNLLTNWTATNPGILKQLKAVKKASRKLTGFPITHAFYTESVPNYIANDPVIQAIIKGSSRVAEEAITAEIPESVGKLKWIPIDQAFFVDGQNNARDWFADPTVVFTPDPSIDWWEFVEGTYPVPRSIQLAAAMDAVLGNFQQVAGPFSYASITINPPGITHYAGDTFLPVLKNPKAIFIATIPTS